MLSPYRVLDLTTERGLLCGQILGDLGADVIKVEPPGGSPARNLGPFYHDEPYPDRSLYWWAYNRNKRSVTLDLRRPEGRELFLRMVKSAHFLIESDDPGHLAALGLGYEDLRTINPGLIYISITPFGQDGPKASYAACDLIVLAAGGPLILGGDDDRPPVRVNVPQGYLHACADAAVAAMVAHHERCFSQLGQQVDVSAQQSVAIATQAGILAAPLNSEQFRRATGGTRVGPLTVQLVWPAKDGWISATVLFGSALGVFTKKLMAWLCEQGWCDEATRDKDWLAFGEKLASGEEPFSEYDRIRKIVASFTASRTKAELLQLALEKGFLFAPITTIDEVVESEQLKARSYFQPLQHPELGRSFLYPGPFAKFGESPLVYRRRAPTVGEHNREIYRDELGITESEFLQLQNREVI